MSDALKRTHQQLVEGELEEGHFRGEGQQAGDQAQRIGPGIPLVLVGGGLAAGVCIAVHNLGVDGPELTARVIGSVGRQRAEI